MNEQVSITSQNGVMSISAPLDRFAADRQAAMESRRMNAGRRIPKPDLMLLELAEQKKVWIYNVSPKQFTRYMGSTGTFTIKACEEGREYSDPIEVPGLVFEPVPKNEHSMELQHDAGLYVAEQIIGIGKMLRPSDCLTKYGVFISTTCPPNKKAVADARKEFHAFLQTLVNEMNDADAMGPQKRQEVQTEEHFMAAHVLGLDEAQCPWMRSAHAPAERSKCPGCGTPFVVGIQKCSASGCGFILDKPAYEASVLAGDYGETAQAQLRARKNADVAKQQGK